MHFLIASAVTRVGLHVLPTSTIMCSDLVLSGATARIRRRLHVTSGSVRIVVIGHLVRGRSLGLSPVVVWISLPLLLGCCLPGLAGFLLCLISRIQLLLANNQIHDGNAAN